MTAVGGGEIEVWRHLFVKTPSMQATSISSSTQFTVHHHEQRSAGMRSAGIFALDAGREAHGLLKTVESVYMQSMSHQDQLKRQEREQRLSDDGNSRLHEELHKLRSQLAVEEHKRSQDATVRPALGARAGFSSPGSSF